MIPDIGEVLLAISFVLSAALFASPYIKRISNLRFSIFASDYLFFMISGSFLCLIYSYIVSDFSVSNVFKNSSEIKPLIYKITGVWGNHEGSMLLFLWIMSLISFLFSSFSSTAKSLKQHILSIQGGIIFCIASYVLFTSNPFERIFPAPKIGVGLNPLLQDIGLAIHPPLLYIGYAGFSLAFSFAIAGLLQNKINKDWAGKMYLWVILAWSFLTLGIGVGSWWAYRELGWGGFWFWDPVENSSLMPWLCGTALLHCLIVVVKRDALKQWAAFLSITTFCLSIIGFFLVRSGILSSVHSFASDPYRGMFMLALFAVLAGSAFFVFFLKAKNIKKNYDIYIFSREGGMLFNNLVLITLCVTILIGTIYPIFLEVISGVRVSVGAPYFNIIFVPIAIFLIFISAIGSVANWKEEKGFLRKIIYPLLLSIAVFLAVFYSHPDGLMEASAIFAGAFLLLTMLSDLFKKIKWQVSNIKLLPLKFYAVFISHVGVALLVIAISLLNLHEYEGEFLVKEGQRIKASDYEVNFLGADVITKDNYIAKRGVFSIWEGKKEVAKLYPENRIYLVEGSKTTESSIYSTIFSDLYIVIGDNEENDDEFAVRIYKKPFISFIWISCIMFFIGGMLSVYSSRRR